MARQYDRLRSLRAAAGGMTRVGRHEEAALTKTSYWVEKAARAVERAADDVAELHPAPSADDLRRFLGALDAAAATVRTRLAGGA